MIVVDKVKKISIISLFIAFGIIVYLRTSYQTQLSDDLLYKFVLDDGPLGYNVSYDREVLSLADAIESQNNQYRASNGRYIVHVIVQMFAGSWGWSSFAVFNTLLFLIAILLTGLLVIPRQNVKNPIRWVLLFIAFLYLFQCNGKLWYSIAGSLNYLYPIALCSSFFIVFNKIRNNQIKLNIFQIISCILLGFFTGWSQESYSVPLAGGVLIWLIYHRKDYKRKIWLLVLPLWLGTILNVIAPGNFVRMGYQPDHWDVFKRGVLYLCKTWFFWIALLLSIFFYIKDRELFIEFCKRNSLYLFCCIIVISFGCYANTLPQSFNGVSYFLCIISFLLVDYIFPNVKGYTQLYWTIPILLIVFINQIRIIIVEKYKSNVEKAFIEAYLKSKDGTVTKPMMLIPKDVSPFVYDRFNSDSTTEWEYHVIVNAYSNKLKPIIIEYKSTDGVFSTTLYK